MAILRHGKRIRASSRCVFSFTFHRSFTKAFLRRLLELSAITTTNIAPQAAMIRPLTRRISHWTTLAFFERTRLLDLRSSACLMKLRRKSRYINHRDPSRPLLPNRLRLSLTTPIRLNLCLPSVSAILHGPIRNKKNKRNLPAAVAANASLCDALLLPMAFSIWLFFSIVVFRFSLLQSGFPTYLSL